MRTTMNDCQCPSERYHNTDEHIRTALRSIVYHSCAYEQFLQINVDLDLVFLFFLYRFLKLGQFVLRHVTLAQNADNVTKMVGKM